MKGGDVPNAGKILETGPQVGRLVEMLADTRRHQTRVEVDPKIRTGG